MITKILNFLFTRPPKTSEVARNFRLTYSAYNHPRFDSMIANWQKVADTHQDTEVRKVMTQSIKNMIEAKKDAIEKINNS